MFFDNVEDPYQLNNLSGNPDFEKTAKELEKCGHKVDSTGLYLMKGKKNEY